MSVLRIITCAILCANVLAFPTAVHALGGGFGGGGGTGGGGTGGGGPNGAPIPLLGTTLLGNAALLGGGYAFWRRRDKKRKNQR